MEQSGVAATADVLRQVPQVVNLGADEGRTNAVANANANITLGTGINLRGLGTESTLTLLNGRRVVPNGTMAQFVDPSMIPTLAINRREVVPDGASATYGSDAVGGVVNMLLRQHYDGAQTDLRYSEGKGLDGWQASQLLGKTWSSGDVMFTYEHYERNNLKASDRDFYTDNFQPFGGPDLRSVSSNPGNILVGTTRYPIPRNQNGVGLTAAQLVAGAPNLQTIYVGADALPEQRRDSAVATFNQQLFNRVNFFADGYYAERDFVRYSAAQAPNLTVPRSNPFFVSPVAGAQSVTVNYSFVNELALDWRRARNDLECASF